MSLKGKSSKRAGEFAVSGRVQLEQELQPAVGVSVLLYSSAGDILGSAKTGKDGSYEIALQGQCEPVFFSVQDSRKRELLSTRHAPLAIRARRWAANLEIPAGVLRELTGKKLRPTVLVGALSLDAENLSKAEPEVVLNIARIMVGQKIDRSARARIEALSPDLIPQRYTAKTLCGTQILRTIDALIQRKQWPREIGLTIDRILSMREFGFGGFVELCPNFAINYDTTGAAAVDPSTAAANVIDPGTANVIGMLPAGGAPTYIKLVCFWLERALNSYTSPPFSMLNPAGGGRIQVYINTAPFGSAGATAFYLNNALAPDLLCAVAVHELFHMVQFQYGGSGAWGYSLTEGGAVFAEDSAADSMNRYLDEACTNFNGVGVQSNPNTSLVSAGYKCSLFFRYVAEQHSPLITAMDEPKIGVETYRTILERCSAGSYSTADVKQAIQTLPWYQNFYEFDYLDAAKLDLTSNEITFGNYVLACYLKDLGTSMPDRRFDFMEDDDNIYIDDVLRATVNPGLPSNTTLIPPVLSGTATITSAMGASFSGSVNEFATRYYELTIDPTAANVTITWTAGAGLTSCVFQLALIDEDGNVRDIHRSDRTSYSKFITSIRAGKRLTKILCAVSGANSSGSFTVSVSPASPAADVMVTRWHSLVGHEYHIDSRNWAWTWVSPDIWVDNDGDGIADGIVFFNFNNQVQIRLHNKGNAAASGLSVNFWYQDASGGLSDAAWMPVQDTLGTTQVLTGLSVAADSSAVFTVNWSPAPSGTSHHFCIRAVVSSADANTDNKRLLSNFGNVVMMFSRHIDIDLVRRNPLDWHAPVEMVVVPRMAKDFELSPRDLKALGPLALAPGETIQDRLRVTHRPIKAVQEHAHDARTTAFRANADPDPTGNYPVDPDSLPPGVSKMPMITVVHRVDGRALGGVTFLLTPSRQGAHPKPPKVAGRRKAVKRK